MSRRLRKILNLNKILESDNLNFLALSAEYSYTFIEKTGKNFLYFLEKAGVYYAIKGYVKIFPNAGEPLKLAISVLTFG
jgi:hypothetical protein